jgi:hypothetical protein
MHFPMKPDSPSELDFEAYQALTERQQCQACDWLQTEGSLEQRLSFDKFIKQQEPALSLGYRHVTYSHYDQVPPSSKLGLPREKEVEPNEPSEKKKTLGSFNWPWKKRS